MRLLTFGWLVIAATRASAHDPDAGVAAGIDAWAAVLLLVTAALYVRGVVSLWRHAGFGRGVALGRAAAFGAGWLMIPVALQPSLEAAGQRLFSMHMVQHELLMVVAAPLLVLGTPLVAWSWAWPAAAGAVRRAFGRPLLAAIWKGLTAPLGAWMVHAVVLWSWHIPRLFERALANEALHEVQHASFVAAALLYWWSVLNPRVVRHSPGVALLSLFTTMLHTGLLGALLALSDRAWYPGYATYSADPVGDQQLGGLLMWIPGGAVYLAVALFTAARLLGDHRPAQGARP